MSSKNDEDYISMEGIDVDSVRMNGDGTLIPMPSIENNNEMVTLINEYNNKIMKRNQRENNKSQTGGRRKSRKNRRSKRRRGSKPGSKRYSSRNK
uniref:Uncharacterized protein n=1 Tax=viral metagenome TaxID=1070528 RepID=A0A6C0ASM1_9ZZZZ